MNPETQALWDKRNEYWRAKEAADRLRGELRRMEQERDRAKLTHLPPHQRLVLREFVESSSEELAYHFKSVQSWTGLNRLQVSRACKALRRLGLLRLDRGLFNDDGEVAGSGYSLTAIGRAWWDEKEASAETEKAGDVEHG